MLFELGFHVKTMTSMLQVVFRPIRRPTWRDEFAGETLEMEGVVWKEAMTPCSRDACGIEIYK